MGIICLLVFFCSSIACSLSLHIILWTTAFCYLYTALISILKRPFALIFLLFLLLSTFRLKSMIPSFFRVSHLDFFLLHTSAIFPTVYSLSIKVVSNLSGVGAFENFSSFSLHFATRSWWSLLQSACG